MALVWRQIDGDTIYEVRSAGSSIRLYTNGAFHSQYSPKHTFTGGVWDLLSIPACFQSEIAKPTDSVLMLGVGGGAAIHQLEQLLKPAKIIGIEINPIHLQIAKHYFNLSYPNLELIESDALKWIKTHKRKFDLIVDDLFVHTMDDPVRPFQSNRAWLIQLEQRLTTDGLLIQNHLNKKAAIASARLLVDEFASALLFTTPQYENVVCALYKNSADVKSGRQWLKQLRTTRLNYDVKTLY